MSFEELTERISPKLKGIVYKIYRTAPAFSAEDLYQEAVLNLFADYKNSKLSDKTDSYILQSCYFYLKNYIRSSNDKTAMMSLNAPINEEGTELQEVLLLEEEPSAEHGLDMDTLMEQVFNNKLSRKEKEILFFYIQGWTTREIGERVGISHVSVLKLENRIREKCRMLKNSVTSV
jgi:RNA polymerase sigma factor (sigma-70 family)